MSLSDLFLEKKSGESQGPAQPEVTAGYTLLLVDDEPNIVGSLRKVFRQQSYRILSATSGAEAIEIMEKEAVQLVISDYRMPLMTGSELLTLIRSRWPDTIRIMLTGFADTQSIMAAVKENSVFKFMTKPWNNDDLLVTVGRALEQYELQQEVKCLIGKNQRLKERSESLSQEFSNDRGMLAKILKRYKKITDKQHSDIVRQQQRAGGLMYRIAREQEDLNEDIIASALQKSFSLELVDLREVRVSAVAASLLPPDICRDNLIIPIRVQNDELTLAMADPSDIFKRDCIESLIGCRLHVVLCKGNELEQKLREVYGALSEDDAEDAVDPMDEIDIVLDVVEEVDIEEMLESSVVTPVVRIVNSIIGEALTRSASDIHIEPRVKYTAVRYRIDGLLQERVRLPSSMHPAVTSRIKILGKMDIAERRRPQDGRITVRVAERMVDLRVSTLPVLYGENVVLRVLDRGATVKRVEELGLEKSVLTRVRLFAQKPQGMFICTGPTGSGKTTTLYSLLRERLNAQQSYGTIEDPVEYYVEETAQVHVREKTGLTFPVALRAMLRQDPDVLLVGEMRDRETADIGFRAAMTGHMVFSTLHTINAVASIARLLDLGMKPYILASSLTCILAQRLLRTTCPMCRAPAEPDPELLRMLELEPEDVAGLQHGSGCNACSGTGHLGRLGIFEVLEISEKVKELILSGATQSEIAAEARENGLRSFFEDALLKVRQGETTLAEILRVIGPRTHAARLCVQCGGRLKPGFKVCPSCGHFVRRTCNKCDSPLDSSWKFCVSCGHSCDHSRERVGLVE